MAQAVLAGELTEAEGRWKIASIVLTEDIPASVSREIVSENRQLQADAEEHLRALLIDKIAGTNPNLDVQRIANGASISGWSRQLLRSPFARFHVLELGRGHKSRPIPVDPFDRKIVDSSCVDSEWSGPQGEERAESFLSAAAAYAKTASNRRANERIHLSARTLCRTYGLSSPRRCVYLPNRVALLARLEGDECAVQDDVMDTIEDMDHGYRGLAVVFEGWSLAELSEIAEVPAIASQRIALAALTPSPPPVQPHCSALRSALLASYPEVGGSHAVGGLVRRWVDVTTEACGSEYRAGEAVEPKPAVQRAKDELAWHQTVVSLVQRGVESLGVTPAQVAQTLSAMMETIIEPCATCRQGPRSGTRSNIGSFRSSR